MFSILDRILAWLGSEWSTRRVRKRELETLKTSLLMTRIVNNLDTPLDDLRQFFQRNPELINKHKANSEFVERWLMDPYLQAFGSVPGMWTQEKLKNLRVDTLGLCA